MIRLTRAGLQSARESCGQPHCERCRLLRATQGKQGLHPYGSLVGSYLTPCMIWEISKPTTPRKKIAEANA